MRVLIINGAPRSGKDTFIRFVKEAGNCTYAYSSIDWVKEKAVDMGWDGVKDERGRRFLSDIKDAATRYDDIPFKKVIEHFNVAYGSGYDFFAVNIRESGEIKKLESYCAGVGVKCFTVLVSNAKAAEESKKLDNHADLKWMNYNYSHVVNNNSTLEVFRRNVINFLEFGLTDEN